MRLPTRTRFAESTKDLTMSPSASERTSGNGGRGPVRAAVALSASVVLSGMLTSAGLSAALALLGVVLTTALYALVWFPLREQLQWGWILGIVFASMALLTTVANATERAP